MRSFGDINDLIFLMRIFENLRKRIGQLGLIVCISSRICLQKSDSHTVTFQQLIHMSAKFWETCLHRLKHAASKKFFGDPARQC